ncbi:MAG: N-acetylneuraminate synthase family protein [Candidatus Sungbacteria bacterium]|nr:N-acetylneuraminate synthase family protein [Candidatus Sungbacteria bacterium]
MPKIIVEVCQNHNGDRALLKDLIHAAAESGADIIKGQIIFSEDTTRRERFDAGHVEHNGVRKAIHRPYGAEASRLRALDLAEADYHFFVEEVKRAGAVPMLTVFSRKRIPLSASLPYGGERLVKVASYDCGSFPMIRELADNFDTLVVSTGATFNEEVEETARILKEKNKRFTLLHCVTSYPNTLSMANLTRMEWLRKFTPEVGWSDHTLVARDGIKAAQTALMLGADYIERHFTVLPADKTKDGPVSINPSQLKELSRFAKIAKDEQRLFVDKEIPEWRIMLGHAERDMTHTEMLNRDYYRGRFASLVGNEWVYNWEEKTVLKNRHRV